MKKRKKFVDLITGAAFAAIIFAACENNQGDWDGTDYYTGKDTTINHRTYRFSSMGYYYLLNKGKVSRYYPNTGFSQTLPLVEHQQGKFLSSPSHVENGGFHSTPHTFVSSRGGGFGGTSRGSGFHTSS